MKKTHPLIVLLVALVLALPVSAQDAEPTNLRPNWTVGQTTRYDFWGKTEKNETAQIFGQQQSETTTFTSEGRVVWIVKEVNADGSAVCSMNMTRIKFSITAGENEPIVLDSDKPTGDRPAFDGLMSALVATPLTVTVGVDGTIQKVEGIDALTQAAGTEAVEADVIPDEIDFKETASELASLIAAPASATIGQTWQAKNTWNHEDIFPSAETKADYNTTFTFESLGNIAGVPIATIKSSSDINFKVDLSKLPDEAPDIDVQFSDASGKGEILFDLSRHEAVARNDSMTYTASITVTPPKPDLPPITVKIIEKNQSQLLRIAEE